jgi:tetratricopeptide (TPR) repeat protein
MTHQKNSPKRFCMFGLFFSLLFLRWPLFSSPSVKIWKEPLKIPSYRVNAPEKNPIFYNGRAYQGAKGPIYPYPLIDNLTDIREDKDYTALYLENDYLRLAVLPEIGGRIIEAIDKTNGYHFFYRQHVIKPALIGMLGAWISGGVEWNIPHHHRATTFLPVDYALEENSDGSKTIWVGELELRHRMRWIVGLTLYPERSVIEVTIKIFNRTPLSHSILCWANTAAHATPEYQVIFPPDTEWATFHGKNQMSHWPISTEIFNHQDYSKGVDVSWWKSHAAPTSFFAWESQGDFFAGYDHGKKAGVAFVADHAIVPGKKLWTWGTGPEGRLWEKILTDADGPYAELMIGAYSDNQPDYSWCQPYETKTAKMYWYPLRELGGVTAANSEAACNLAVKHGGLALIGINATREYQGGKVLLKAGEKILCEEIIAAGPSHPYRHEVVLPAGAKEEDLELVFLSAEGKAVISYRPVKKKGTSMPEPVLPPPAPEEMKTNEELYQAGLRLEQFHNPALEPYPYYEEVLRRDPGDSRVNVALARLYLKRAMYPEAEERLRLALQRMARKYTRLMDAEAFYYLGVALRAQGKNLEAEEALQKAVWDLAWRAASFEQLAEMEAGKGDFLRASEFINSSLDTNALNSAALNLKTVLLRKLGKMEEAGRQARGILAGDPLDFWAANELHLAESGLGRARAAAEILDMLSARMRDSVPNYLELATDYGHCGLWDEAIEVLKRLAEPRQKAASTFPLVYYYLAYFYSQKGNNDRAFEYLKQAGQMPPDYCFPFQQEAIEVLRWAQKTNPGDGRAPYYLGNLLFDLQPETAIAQWEKARGIDGTLATVHRNLGLAYARVKNDVSAALASLSKAVACDPGDPKLYYELDLMSESGGIEAQKRLSLLEKNHRIVEKRDDALSREIGLLVQTGKYDRAIGLLQSHHFHVWEGGGDIHNTYVDAFLLRGLAYLSSGNFSGALQDFKAALEYPANLEVAPPSRGGGSAKIYYFIGEALEKLGQPATAKEAYEKASSFEHGYSALSIYQGLALRELGQEEKAIQILDALIQSAQEKLKSVPAMDFFEKFGEKQSARAQEAQAHYILGLALLGKGKRAEAKAEFARALELDINHVWAHRELSAMR